MDNIYFVQPSNSLSGSFFLPYAAGTIAAYCLNIEEICNKYELKPFLYKKENIAEALSRFDNPKYIGFSCYMWNIEYNLALAEKVKQSYPDCMVIFGGPQIPDSTQYLYEYPFIDILIHGEGEKTFSEILLKKDLCEICNISYREKNGIFKTVRAGACSLENHPSPYTMGLFDYIVDDPSLANVQFDAVMETNRGCPYNCMYCCWSGGETKIRTFSMEKVKSELLWMARKKISYFVCADSNFGILDRDEEIADYVIELKKEYGYPQKMETTSAKNKDDLTFRINCKLEEAELNRGVSLAVQSMSPEVLEIIGRKNMSVNLLCSQFKKYREKNVYTYTDLILGLPGETLESFCKGLFDVIEAGQHYSINVFSCEFLPNTTLSLKETVEKYSIKTVKSYFPQNHSCVDENDIYGSRSEIVVSTDTMSVFEWKKAVYIANCVQAFHCLGLLRYIAIYLRKFSKISYYDFYMKLIEKIFSEDCYLKEEIEYVLSSVDGFLEGRDKFCFSDSRFGNIRWPFSEGLFLSCAYSSDKFYKDAFSFLKEMYGNLIPNDLFEFQKNVIALPGKSETNVKLYHDWIGYFRNIYDDNNNIPAEKEMNVSFAGSKTDNWADYARYAVWYGKRNNKMINEYFESDS